ncbi:TonB-dependent receptor [Thalassotalea psychrophila]|uniref:TonB-dependent receptor n=1 Tax=Thalassotalea psychrophila TaxID=3065647 RepID=A0ABY9TWZ0_9GAMM|nr:TonB-dependent receptor [Colwelliaceae bacterium SQ149]
MLDNSKKSLLALSILAILHGTAWAQEESTATAKVEADKVTTEQADSDVPKKDIEDIEVIEVQGTRGSLKRSMNAKRYADQVMDGISAEDIGKLPDNNIAEALSRVVGVSLSREDGEGQYISIRGMDPSLSTVTVNGQTMGSTANGSAETSGSRSVNLNNVDSSMVSAIEVFKSPTANMIEGSIGGTVNLKSRDPIATGDRGSIGIKGEYNEISEEYGNALNLLLNTANEAETFGANLTVSTYNRTTQRNSFESKGWRKQAKTEGLELEYADIPGELYKIEDIRSKNVVEDRDRINVGLKLQWLPTDSLDAKLNILYGKQDISQESLRSIYIFRHEKRLIDADSIEIDYEDADSSERTLVDYGEDPLANSSGNVIQEISSWNPASASQNNYESEAYFSEAEKEIYNVSLSVDIDVSENLTITPIIGMSSAEDKTEWVTPAFAANADNIGFRLENGTWDPEIIYSDDPADLHALEPENMYLKRLSFAERSLTDDQTFQQVDFNYQLDSEYFRGIEFGLRHSDNEKDWDPKRSDPTGTVEDVESAIGEQVMFADYAKLRTINNQTKYAPQDSWFAPIEDKIVKNFKQYAIIESTPTEPYNIKEEVFAGYVQVNIDATLFDIPVRGNAGVRYVETKVEASANRNESLNGQEWVWTTFENDYEDVLPSVNLAFILTEDFILRAAGASVMARPNHRQLAPGFRYVDDGKEDPHYNFGNPYLSPYRANQYDLSAEWYFNAESLVSVGLFYKDIDNFIVTINEERTIPEYNNGFPIIVKQPINGEEAEVSGVEFSYQQAFVNLPSPFDGLGTAINYTYNDTNAELPNDVNNAVSSLPGFSKDTFNTTVYWEKYGANIRLAYNFRSEYFKNYAFTGETVHVDDFEQLDLSAGYRFNKTMSVSFVARNILGEETFEYVNIPSQAFSAKDNGRTYSLGFKYNF